MTKQAINTRTQEEYDALMEWRKRNDQNYLGPQVWLLNGSKTCIDFESHNPYYSNIEYYQRHNFEIIPYTEFAKTIKPEISLENWIRMKLDEVEQHHEYEVATDTVRAWIDLYNHA